MSGTFGFKFDSVALAKKIGLKTKKLQNELEAKAFKQAVLGVEKIRGEIVLSLMSESAGETVTRYPDGGKGQKRKVVVSRPGDAPNTDTGRLVRSIRTEHNEQELSASVLTNERYAADLEFGTSKMEPRPFFLPALARVKPRLVPEFRKELKKTAQEVGKKFEGE